MKKLIVSGFLMVSMIAIFGIDSRSLAQTNRLPNQNSPSKYQGVSSDDIIYDESDFAPPPVGQVMMAHWKDLVRINHKIGEDLLNAPDNATGKQSQAYPPLQAWKGLFDHFISTKNITDLLVLIPEIVAYRNRPEQQRSSPEMRDVSTKMIEVVRYVVEALAAKIPQSGGVLSNADLGNAVDLFSIEGLVDGTMWDPPEISMPLYPAGIMIIDAEAVVTKLKAEPWQRAKCFLGGETAASSYFARYTGDGEGVAVLKTKYTANQAAIDAKFNELKTWVAQQQQQAGGGD